MTETTPGQGCLPQGRLEALAAGEPADERDHAHLAGCRPCHERLEEISANNAFLVELRQSRAGEAAPLGGELQPGEAIPGYTLLGELARGGQGVVYRAVQIGTGRPVAIKMLASGAFASAQQRQRFQQEIETVAGLRHPNIVTVYETGSLPGGRAGYVMALIEGQPLDAWARGLPEPEGARAFTGLLHRKLAVFERICDAVQHAHRHGIIHRDLKPDNILVDAQDQPQVLDFGIARALGRETPASATLTGEFIGTIRYASPEQLAGQRAELDTRTDVYTLGVLLYELLCGQHPQPASGSIEETIRAIREVEPQRLGLIDARLPMDVCTIAAKALAKEPDRRYQSAGALGEDIRRYLAGEPIEARRDSTWYVLRKTARRHRTPVLLGGGLVASLVALVVGLSVLYSHAESRRRQAEAALSERYMEQGRGAMRTGSATVAADVLWREFLTGRPGPGQEPDRPGPDGAYWALVELYARHPCLRTIDAHAGGALSVRFADGGRTLVSVGEDGAVRQWDPHTGDALGVLQEGGRYSGGLTTDRPGRRVAWATRDGHITVWDVRAGAPVGEWDQGGELASVSLSPDGQRLAWLAPGALGVWDLATGERRSVDIEGFRPQRVAFSPDGDRLAVLAFGRVSDVDASTLRRRAAFERADIGGPGLAWSDDGGRIYYPSRYDVWAWRPGSGGDPERVAHHDVQITALALLPSDGRVLTAGIDRGIRIWDGEMDKPVAVLWGHADEAKGLSISPDGSLLASAAYDGTIRLWPLMNAAALRPLPGHADTVFALAVHAETGEVYAGGGWSKTGDGSSDGGEVLRRSQADSFASHRPLHAEGEALIYAVDLSSDGRTLVTADYDGAIRVRDTSDGALRYPPLRGDEAWNVYVADLSPDDATIASAGPEGAVHLWDAATGSHQRTLDGPGYSISTLCFNAAGDLLSTASPYAPRGTIDVWDPDAGVLLRQLPGHRGGTRVTLFAADGDTLVSAGDDRCVRLWNARTGEALAVLEGHQGDIFALAFGPRGRLLASGGRDGLIKIWDMHTGEELLALRSPHRMVFALAFTPDGRSLLTGGRGEGGTPLAVLDLGRSERHIAGNLAHHADRLRGEGVHVPRRGEFERWARDVLDEAEHAPRPH